MAKITRFNGNLEAFAKDAQGQERTVFNNTTQSDDLTTNLTNDFIRGWGVLPEDDKPPKQWFNGAMFTATQLLAYLHQMGVAEWNAAQEYQIGSAAIHNGSIYICKTANHTSATNPVSDGANWKKDLDVNDVVNSLSSTSTNTPLSAAQGKALQDNKVNKTQTIGTALPLQGGGNLSGNLSLSIQDGTTAQKGAVQLNNTLTSTSTSQALTAAQGKVLQDTTVKTSGNQTITGTKTFNGVINGTAVTQSATDTTAGRLLKVGDFGVGVEALNPATDLNNLQTNGVFQFGNNPANRPSAIGSGTAFVCLVQNWTAFNLTQQTIFVYGSLATNRMYQRKRISNVWGDWVEFYHTGNLSPVETTGNQTIAGVKTFSNNSVFNGFVGIGVTNPQSLLTIGGTSNPRLDMIASGASGATARLSSGANNAFVGSTTNHPINFIANNQVKARIEPDGRQRSVHQNGTFLYEEYKTRVWANFNCLTTPVTIRASGNVSSIGRVSNGIHVVNFISALPTANYAPVIDGGSQGGQQVAVTAFAGSNMTPTAPETTRCGVKTVNFTNGSLTNFGYVSFKVTI